MFLRHKAGRLPGDRVSCSSSSTHYTGEVAKPGGEAAADADARVAVGQKGGGKGERGGFPETLYLGVDS